MEAGRLPIYVAMMFLCVRHSVRFEASAKSTVAHATVRPHLISLDTATNFDTRLQGFRVVDQWYLSRV
jgi:hypothetical protein